MAATLKRIDKTQTDLQTEKNLKLLERFALVHDNDGVQYVIPLNRKQEFDAWVLTFQKRVEPSRFMEFKYSNGLLTFLDPAVN